MHGEATADHAGEAAAGKLQMEVAGCPLASGDRRGKTASEKWEPVMISAAGPACLVALSQQHLRECLDS